MIGVCKTGSGEGASTSVAAAASSVAAVEMLSFTPPERLRKNCLGFDSGTGIPGGKSKELCLFRCASSSGGTRLVSWVFTTDRDDCSGATWFVLFFRLDLAGFVFFVVGTAAISRRRHENIHMSARKIGQYALARSRAGAQAHRRHGHTNIKAICTFFWCNAVVVRTRHEY